MVKQFRTIVIDPPWKELGGGKIKRGANKHYAVLSVPAIIKTVVESDPFQNIADDAHLYLWVTNSFLPSGLDVMNQLGFKYKTNVCWTKDRFGLGQYFRGNHELCLFGTRGKGYNVKTPSRSIASIIKAKRRKHSQKPEEFYNLVESRSYGPYVDMFARGAPRNNSWITWGHEAV